MACVLSSASRLTVQVKYCILCFFRFLFGSLRFFRLSVSCPRLKPNKCLLDACACKRTCVCVCVCVHTLPLPVSAAYDACVFSGGNVCARNATCTSRNLGFICNCNPGLTGDPTLLCKGNNRDFHKDYGEEANNLKG